MFVMKLVVKMSLPINNISYGRPRSGVRSKTLKDSLEGHLIPLIVANVHVIGIRCVFDFTSTAEAVKHLAVRRRKLEVIIREIEEVNIFLSF